MAPLDQSDAAQELVGAADHAYLLHVTGNLAHAQADYAWAAALYEAGLQIRRNIGDISDSAVSLHNLGPVAYEQGEYERSALEPGSARLDAADRGIPCLPAICRFGCLTTI